MKAILIGTSGESQTIEIKGETVREQTKSLQKAVGGHFNAITLSPECVMIVDDDGLLKNKPKNLKATQASGMHIVGDALVLGVDGDMFTDVPEHIETLLLTLFGIGGGAL